MKRLDIYLFESGRCRSRSAAAALIRAGKVKLRGPSGEIKMPKQPSFDVEELRDWEYLIESAPFVSRAGEKLAGALQTTGLTPKDLSCLDIGQSTGGFTDCLLQSGAKTVVGLEVGHDQLVPELRNDPRVRLIEGFNGKDLSTRKMEVLALNSGQRFDLVVMDVSFISMTAILPGVADMLGERGVFLGLVKPQFEVGPDGLGKGGIVRDESLFSKVETKACNACNASGLTVEGYFESSLKGMDGNREFFVFARKPG